MAILPVQRQLLFDGEENDLIASGFQRRPVPDIGFFTGIITRFHRYRQRRGYKLRAGRLPAHIASDTVLGFQLPVATIAFPGAAPPTLLLAVLIAPERKPKKNRN